jgi:hypothetical protein
VVSFRRHACILNDVMNGQVVIISVVGTYVKYRTRTLHRHPECWTRRNRTIPRERRPCAVRTALCEPACRRGDGALRRLHNYLRNLHHQHATVFTFADAIKENQSRADDSRRDWRRRLPSLVALDPSQRRPYRFRDQWPRSHTFQPGSNQTASRHAG